MSRDNVKDPLLSHADRLMRRARLWLFWERYAPAFALAALITTGFLIGSFAGVWERIGDPWRALALIISLYVLVRAILCARAVTVPTQSDAARRVETDNDVSHRPLDVLRDNPVMAGELWESHVASARLKAADLRHAKLAAVLAPRDKYYLRFAAPLAFILAVMVGAGDNLERLKRSLTPTWQSAISSKSVTFDAWVDPPDYTGRPPVYFKNKRKVEIPAGSELVARISGTKDAPRLKITTHKGSKYLGLTRLGPTSFEARTTLDESATARWRVGTLEKKWQLAVLPDTPPTVSIDQKPKADKRDRLALTYSMSDDFGVTGLTLDMTLLDSPEAGVQRVSVPLSSTSVRKATNTETALDMTKHIWTGRKVKARLVATDGLGQSAMSAFENFTVPDKIFIEPLAKAIVEQRNLVLSASGEPYAPLPRRTRKEWANMPYFDGFQTDQKLGRAPASIQRAALLIDAITDEPAGLYKDPAVYMGLKNILGRMRYARDQDGLAGISEDLWNIAIRAEFGILGTALQEMQEAEMSLNEGIARRAAEREVDTLFDRYNAAVDRYMEELRRKAIAEGNIAEDQGGEGGGGGRNADEIKELLKAIEEANARGDSEGARKALKKLAALLENMEVKLSQGGQGGEGGDPSQGELSEDEKKSLEELADLLGEQRELKDETEQSERAQNKRALEEGSQAGSGASGDQSGVQTGNEAGKKPQSAEELAEQQGALEALLEKLDGGLPAMGALRDGGEERGGASGDDVAGRNEDGQPNDQAENSGGGEFDPDGKGKGSAGQTALSKSPEQALADANEAMRAAKDALNSGDLAAAAEAQAKAIQALRDAANGIVQTARDRGQGEEGQPSAEGSGNPLGQEQGDQNNDSSEADIDQRDNATKSRELMEELRRRAAEQERDEAERDYLERLLKRF